MSLVNKITLLSSGRAINVLVNLLFLPYMARVFPYEDYGTYGQVILVISLLAAIMSFGQSQIIYVFLNEEKEDKVVGSNILAVFITSLISIFFVWLIAPAIATFLENEKLADLLLLFSISIFFTSASQSIRSYLIHSSRVKQATSVIVIGNTLKVFLVVFMVQYFGSVKLALVGILISNLIQFLHSLYYCRKVLISFPSFRLSWKQLQRGWPLGLSGILGIGILYSDGLMVSKMEGVEAYAIYRNGALEVPFVGTLYASVASIVMPEVAKLYQHRSFWKIILLKRRAIKYTAYLIYPILFFLLFNSSDLIVLYLGDRYIYSAVIFSIFNLTLLMRVNDYNDIFVAANRNRSILINYLLVFLLNLLLNYLLIEQIGIKGAAISTVFSLFLFAFIMIRGSLKLVSGKWSELIDLRSLFTVVFSASLFSAVLSFLMTYLNEAWLRLLLSALIYFPLIYLMLIRLDKDFRELCKRQLAKILKR